MALPYSFSNNTTPTGPQLDADLAALGALGVIPCTITGTNALVFAPNTNTPTINAYANYLRFSGIAVATNTGATTARVGSLTALPVYRDSPAGPVALAGGEIVINCAFTLVYDSTLNSSNGGWHLVSTANAFPYTGGTIAGSVVLTNGTLSTTYLTGASINAPTIVGNVGSLSKLSVGASAASITRILSGLATLSYTVVPTQLAQDQNMTLAGVQLGDSVQLGYTVAQTAALFGAYVPAAGTISVRVLNAGTGSLAAFSVVMRATAHGFT